MKARRNTPTKLTEALAAAYREKEGAEVDELWQIRVMNHVRRLDPIRSEALSFKLFEQYVWRFAAVACLLILMLAVVLIRGEFIPEYEIAQAFMEDPTRLDLLAYIVP